MLTKIKNKAYKLLRFSEKYTKTDMIYLTKGSFWIGVSKIFTSTAAFILAIAFANFLSQETYGAYKYIISIAALLSIASLRGMGSAAVVSISRGFEGAFWQTYKARIKWSLFGSLGSLGIGAYYFINQNIELGLSFIIISFFIPFFYSSNLYLSFFQAKRLFKYASIYQAANQVISAMIMITTVYLTDKLFIIILAYFIPLSILRSLLILIIFKKFKRNNKTEKDTVSYGKNLSLMSVLGQVAGRLETILLWHFMGAAEVAIFAFALNPVQQIRSVCKSVNTLLLPKISKRKVEELKIGGPKKSWRIILVLLPIVIIYIIGAPYLYKYVFPQYESSVIFSQILALTIFSASLAPISQIFKAHKKTKELYFLNTSKSMLKLILLAVLIPFFGIWGLVSAKLSLAVFDALTTLIFFKKLKD